MSTRTQRSHVTLDELPDFVSPEQVGRLLPMLGTSTIYNMLADGTIPSKRLGRSYIISKAWLQHFLTAPGVARPQEMLDCG